MMLVTIYVIKVLSMVTATAREENGEFCITVGPVTRNSDSFDSF